MVRKYQKFHSYPLLEEHPGSLNTNVLSILSLAKVVKMHGFHDNLLSDLQEWGCTYKNYCIPAVEYPRLLNSQIQTYTHAFDQMVRYANNLICILMNINENLKNG